MRYYGVIFLLLFSCITNVYGEGGRTCRDWLRGSTSIGNYGDKHTELRRNGKVVSVCKQLSAGHNIYSPQRYKFTGRFNSNEFPEYHIERQGCGINMLQVLSSLEGVAESIVDAILGDFTDFNSINVCHLGPATLDLAPDLNFNLSLDTSFTVNPVEIARRVDDLLEQIGRVVTDLKNRVNQAVAFTTVLAAAPCHCTGEDPIHISMPPDWLIPGGAFGRDIRSALGLVGLPNTYHIGYRRYTCIKEEEWGSNHGGSYVSNFFFSEDDSFSERQKHRHYIFVPENNRRQMCLKQAGQARAIGCVDRLFTMVGPYRNELEDEDKVRIDNEDARYYVENYGSSFIEPIIRLQYGDSSQLLKYKFHNGREEISNNIPVCAEFGSGSERKRYCAIVPNSNKAQVCACEEGLCSANIFLGCVARPSLEESNIALLVDYVENYPSAFLSSEESHQENRVPYVPAIKVSLVKKNANGFLKAFDSNGLEILGDGVGFFYIDANDQLDTSRPVPEGEIIRYDKFLYPGESSILSDYQYLHRARRYRKNNVSIYGINVEANISQIYGDYGMKKVRIVEERRHGCNMYYVLPEVADRGNLLYKSLGDRDNRYCEAALNPCQQSQELAKKTKCPGVYIGANNEICLVARNSGEDDLFFARQSSRCITIPLNE